MNRTQAIASATQALATGYATLYGFDGSSIEDAARAAHTPTGPAIPELIERIAAKRALAAAA